ncbi:efflux RND transporter permease subunit [Paludibacterium sp. THUN1379]|uniref:efflux RND transporter permease subunit n=1 Tax=Paludibacterium sp. THUN1379 TaxID=3112107 RepID=UPI003092BAE8|nr:efflux RND transporter permease subunit [Paludibacterium sp. THUN1379]
MWLTRISVHNPYFATVLMLALVVLGAFSWSRLPVEEFPDIRFPVAVVITEYSGASPAVVESEVSRPLEEALNTISGIKHIRSYSMLGFSYVVAEFELGIDPTVALQDVRDRVGGVQGQFRREIGTPRVSQFNPNDRPLMSLTLNTSQVSQRALTTWVEQVLKKRLQTVPGVGEVKMYGGVSREIRIDVDPYRLEALGLSVPEIADAVREANRDFPAGTVTTAHNELAVRIAGKLKTPEDFARLVVGYRDNRAIALSEVASVSDAEGEQDSVALINGQPGVGLDIRATRGANVVQMADGVHALLAEMQSQMPAGATVHFTEDKSVSIKRSLANVQATLLEGAILTVLIVFLFLGSWRSTVITGLTLPVALIGTLFALQMAGFTLNMMTLMALSLSIGLLIDDAIVVRENIVRHVNLGKGHRQAALDGTNEIGLAVLATTLTIVAVFLPVGFMGGVIGKFFHQFGLTVTVAVLISMLVSFSLDPMLSSIWPDPHRHGDRHKGWLGPLLDGFESLLDRVGGHYLRALQWSLAHRKTVIGLALLLTVGSFALVPRIGGEFMPRQDRGSFLISFKTEAGSTLAYTTDKARTLEVLMRQIPEVKTVGISTGNGDFGSAASEGSLRVDVGPRDQRRRTLTQIIAQARTLAGQVGGIEVKSVSELDQDGGGGQPVSIALRGNDLTALSQAAQQFISGLSKVPGIREPRSSLAEADPSLDIQVRRDAAASLGIDLSRVGQTLSTLLGGSVVTTWEAPDGENYDVRLQVPKSLRRSELLDVLTVAGNRDASAGASMVPLSTVTQLKRGETPREIDRVDLQREITVTANISERDPAAVFADVDRLIKQTRLPDGVSIDQQGDSQNMQEALSAALQALGLGVIFIYMILAAQFRSFTLPVTIMMALPLAFVGVFVALWLWGSTLNMFSVIGIVMLMGLAAKNGILLVDFINQSRREGLSRHEAILAAAQVRLRPIVMTSLAMIFGMLPLALSGGEGAETQRPMAHAIIGGLVTSTLLTLLVVPVVYTLLDGLRRRVRRLIGQPEA